MKTTLPRTTLRAEPHPTADIVAVLEQDTELEVLEHSGKYVKVSAFVEEQGRLIGFVARHMMGMPVSSSSVSSVQGGSITCPTCGANNWERMGVTAGTPIGPRMHSVFLDTGFFGGYQLEARVCLECGNVQLCIDRDDLEDIRGRKK